MNVKEYRKKHNRKKGECTFCGGEVKKPRRTNCSIECTHRINILTNWAYARWHVQERDKGICLHCGFDSVKFVRIAKSIKERGDWTGGLAFQHLQSFMSSLGFNGLIHDLWEADHIIERVRGGTDDLGNLRTLCIPCHKIETSRLAGERAQERRDKNQTLLQNIK